jgi:hypothetical protein
MAARSSRFGKRVWLLALGAVCAVGVVSGAWLLGQRGAAGRPVFRPEVQAVLQQGRVLLVSDRDMDREGTARAREQLRRGEIPSALTQATEEVRRNVLSGEAALFRLRVLDSCVEDGDAVRILVNGMLQGEIPLSKAGSELSLALRPGSAARLELVASRDGGGGVTFGAASSLGETRTRVLRLGESERWDISYR